MNKDKLDTLVKDIQEAFVWDDNYYRNINKHMIRKVFDFTIQESYYIYIHKIVKRIKLLFKPIKKMNIDCISWYGVFDEYRIRGYLYIQRKFPYCIIDKIKEGLRNWK